MISKNDVKYIQSLSHKKNRDADGVFIVETPKVTDEFLQNDFTVKKIYATENWRQPNTTGTSFTHVLPSELERISNLEHPNKVLAVFYQKKMPPLQLANNFTLILDGIQDPGNLGTIIRIADWYGITQIVAAPGTADCYNSKVVQSSMGSLGRVNVYYEDIVPLLKSSTVAIYGALLSGENINKKTPVKEGVLIIGNEGNGISEAVLPYIKYPVTIPGSGKAESLNAAVATGIILSHLHLNNF